MQCLCHKLGSIMNLQDSFSHIPASNCFIYGVNTVANAIFGASWPLYPEVLTTAFHLDEKLVEDLQSQEWVNPT